jgi:diaminopimelate epimerase
MNHLKGLPVSRISGAQNTFFIINVFDPRWALIYPQMSQSEKSQLAIKLCGARLEHPTDGLLFLRPEKGFDFAWDFFNSDGSFAEMCGNAARCCAYFFNLKIKKNENEKMRFLTGAGEITGEVLSANSVRIEMTAVSIARKMRVSGQEGYFVNTGVPHFVLEMRPDAELARELRNGADFGPAGSNITFVHNLTPSSVEAVTFERGVEDFTRACGTGAVAAAMYLQTRQGLQNSVEVRMPGGVLRIENAREGCRPLLTGPVHFEYDFEIS